MIPASLHFAGERLLLDPAGALFWPARRLLAVADLHLEKASAAARRGSLLPPWDSHVTLDRLAALLRRYAPATVIALGDSFHDDDGSERLPAAERQRLEGFARAAAFVWVRGNHDPSPSGLPGTAAPEWQDGPLVFRHAAATGGQGEISGHYHPKASVPARGGVVSRPCFVCDVRRLILPAFGAFTGGLDVRDPAILALFPRGGRLFLLGRERLFSFPLPAVRTTRIAAAP